jgi:hypothetical protein
MKAATRKLMPMGPRYPSVRITPADVVEFSRAQGQQPTIEDVERWLSRQKRCIEGTMVDVVRDNLDKILGEAMMTEYPDPVFDRQYRDIEEAIDTASDAFGQKMNKELYGSSYQVRDMIEIVRRMLAGQDKFAACIAYSLEFGEFRKSSGDSVITDCTECVHLICEGGRVEAEVVAEDACEHGQEVFTPEGR